MLDTLALVWARENGGANIWADPTVKFLDPFTKSGVFLREISARLVSGLAEELPDLRERVDHILTKQVFGIAITYLTSLLARRSVYCSKQANGPFSVAASFEHPHGNIWFERVEHVWVDGRCRYCGAPQKTLDRGENLETHAYAFIHADDINVRLDEIFGGDMQFDVIVGNPPYHLQGGGGGTNDSSIYPLFVEQAKRLSPRFLSMVVPSRWMAGGRDMDEFRKSMLEGGHVRYLVDYTKMSVAFPGVDFEGGVGYFLWDRDNTGLCEYTLVLGDEVQATVERQLDEFDIFVRDTRALSILGKVQARTEAPMSDLVSGDTPFGLATNFSDFEKEPFEDALKLHVSLRGKRVVGWVRDSEIKKNRQLISVWKLLVPKAYGERGAIPASVLGPRIVADPGSVCTQTYLVVGPFESQSEAMSCDAYLRTLLARFLISLRKITQDLPRATYSWLPQQTWDRDWTDDDLFEKYGLDEEEITFIETMIRPMEVEADG